MRSTIRIVLVGDPGAGKSTLVNTLVQEEFHPKVDAVLAEVTITPDATEENVTTVIVDTSSREEDAEQRDAELRKADAVCVHYSVVDMEQFRRVKTFWLPHLRRLELSIPVILVGTKLDKRAEKEDHVLEDKVMPILNEWTEVETCLECSAKLNENVSDVFYFAQKSVVHPTGPILASDTGTLKPKAEMALRRIFTLCDYDKDGHIDDDELRDFQELCFGERLEAKELDVVKDLVRKKCGGIEGVNVKGVTEEGFLFLNLIFIERGRLETTWTILRKFGYDDNLELRQEYVCPPFVVPLFCTAELSSDGIRFLTQLFNVFDNDNDAALSPDELKAMFVTAPGGCPWDETLAVTNKDGYITLQGFLAQWALITLETPEVTLAHMAYLGYPGALRDKTVSVGKYELLETVGALKRNRSKLQDLANKKTSRGTFRCAVVGGEGSGTSAVVQGLVGREADGQAHKAVNAVTLMGAERYLVLSEVSGSNVGGDMRNLIKGGMIDAVCLCYDTTDRASFDSMAEVITSLIGVEIGCVVVGTKCEREAAAEIKSRPQELCDSLDLPGPLLVDSDTGKGMDKIYSHILAVALSPHCASPMESKKSRGDVRVYLCTGAAVVVGLGFVAYRFFRK